MWKVSCQFNHISSNSTHSTQSVSQPLTISTSPRATPMDDWSRLHLEWAYPMRDTVGELVRLEMLSRTSGPFGAVPGSATRQLAVPPGLTCFRVRRNASCSTQRWTRTQMCQAKGLHPTGMPQCLSPVTLDAEVCPLFLYMSNTSLLLQASKSFWKIWMMEESSACTFSCSKQV